MSGEEDHHLVLDGTSTPIVDRDSYITSQYGPFYLNSNTRYLYPEEPGIWCLNITLTNCAVISNPNQGALASVKSLFLPIPDQPHLKKGVVYDVLHIPMSYLKSKNLVENNEKYDINFTFFFIELIH